MTTMQSEDYSSDSEEEEEECLKEMLGGISFDIEWHEEEEKKDDSNVDDDKPKPIPGRVVLEPTKTLSGHDGSTKATTTVPLFNTKLLPTNNQDKVLFQNASCAPHPSHNTSLLSSSSFVPNNHIVQVVDMGEHRGNGLVATQNIPRGATIYTERAFCAIQINGNKVSACQNCFRSLEPVTTLSPDLPCADRWPVLPLDFSTTTKSDEEETKIYNVDKYGRIQCRRCETLFCSHTCYMQFLQDYGSCCSMKALLANVERILMDDNEGYTDEQGPILKLAIKLFAHVVQSYRNDPSSRTAGSIHNHPIWGLCGGNENINALELGTVDPDTNSYSLASIYNAIGTILHLNDDERQIFNLDCFHAVACKTARNCFATQTQSPFKVYYESLLRHNYTSRDSPIHQARMTRLAETLFQQPKLTRDMDRQIEAQCCAEIAAVFLLTARCNHSCQPNAQVTSQQFVDAHMDMVALQDISVGQEILISYIGVGPMVGKKSTCQRRRELRGKYLFECDCPLCRG